MLPQSHCNNKMLLIPSSTTNQWPQKQIHIDDPKATPMDQKQPHQQQQQQQQQQQALKCPRCDSSNTKFCYYNNYSLSQPRHFCKACKRYWTRGGTLRNVPVGGGCRKNKRVKRPNNSATSSSSIIDHHVMPSTSSSNPNPNNINLSSPSNHVNPLFYGLPTNPSELNLTFPRFNSRVSSTVDTGGYDLQPQMNALGLGFSSSGLIMGSEHHHVPNSNSILSSYPIFGSSTSSSTSPSMASIIASSLQQQRFMSLNSYDEESGNFGKEVKLEETANRLLDWNFNTQNQIGQIGSSDPNSLVWNTSDVGAWLDPANMGSSVPSLI